MMALMDLVSEFMHVVPSTGVDRRTSIYHTGQLETLQADFDTYQYVNL